MRRRHLRALPPIDETAHRTLVYRQMFAALAAGAAAAGLDAFGLSTAEGFTPLDFAAFDPEQHFLHGPAWLPAWRSIDGAIVLLAPCTETNAGPAAHGWFPGTTFEKPWQFVYQPGLFAIKKFGAPLNPPRLIPFLAGFDDRMEGALCSLLARDRDALGFSNDAGEFHIRPEAIVAADDPWRLGITGVTAKHWLELIAEYRQEQEATGASDFD